MRPSALGHYQPLIIYAVWSFERLVSGVKQSFSDSSPFGLAMTRDALTRKEAESAVPLSNRLVRVLVEHLVVRTIV